MIYTDKDLIINHPKKAINKLSIPIIISLLLITVNALIDSAWISGLGPDSLAAIGFVTPLILIISSLGNGLGIGTNSIVSRCIGKGDDDNTSNAAVHSIILTVGFSLVISLISLIFLENILIFLGAGGVISYASSYAGIIFAGIIFEYTSIVLAAIIRSEGAVNRAIYPLIASTIINIIIDPIFIYTLHLGIAGAALATIISSALSIIPLGYWIFIKKDTFVKVDFSKYRHNISIYWDIFTVGVPASTEMIIISFVTMFINSLLVIIGGNMAVGAYGVAMRIFSVFLTPVSGIGVANITVVGTAFGAKLKENIKTSFNYSTKLSLIIAIFTFSFIVLFASNLASFFASDATNDMNIYIIHILYILSLSVFTLPLREIVFNILQAMGKGITSLCLIILKELIFTICAYIFAFYLGLGSDGIYYGMLVGGTIGSAIAFCYGYFYIKRLEFK